MSKERSDFGCTRKQREEGIGAAKLGFDETRKLSIQYHLSISTAPPTVLAIHMKAEVVRPPTNK